MMDWSYVGELGPNELTPATEADARELARHMSPEDVAEMAALGLTPLGGCVLSVQKSTEAWTWRPDGKQIAAIFGASPPRQIVGYYGGWVLSTPYLRANGLRFLKYQKPFMAYLLDTFGSIENIVDVRHKTCIRWIRWFGGTIYPAEPLGRNGALFHRWEMKRGAPEEKKLSVKPCRVVDVENAAIFASMAEEYAEESAIEGLPSPITKLETYKQIENCGVFQGYGAFMGQDLIGFISVVVPIIPHYGVGVSMTESFFVARKYRSTGAGLRLLDRAEQHGREAGSPGHFVSAPTASVLEEVLPRRGYEETNKVFFKRFT